MINSVFLVILEIQSIKNSAIDLFGLVIFWIWVNMVIKPHIGQITALFFIGIFEVECHFSIFEVNGLDIQKLGYLVV